MVRWGWIGTGVLLGAMVLVPMQAQEQGRAEAEEGKGARGGAAMVGDGETAGTDSGAHAGELRMLFVDVEGGQATLFVTPEGQSLLVDTGWPGNGGRDADRIVAMTKRAGLKRIDLVVITHYHQDHAGGFAALVARIPVGRVIDHGPNTELSDPATPKAWKAYLQAVQQHHIRRQTATVGAVLPFGRPGGVRAEVVSAAGRVLTTPMPGAGEQNAACGRSPEKAPDGTENDQSIGFLLTWGRLRVLDLGDLTWAKERELVCPANALGPVTVWVVSHHGSNLSNSPALVSAIRPRVAVMDNGAHKGGDLLTFQTMEDPQNGVGALWQVHAAEGVQHELNTAQERMANRAGEDGNWLEVDGRPDGSVTVTNGRTGEMVRYPAAASK